MTKHDTSKLEIIRLSAAENQVLYGMVISDGSMRNRETPSMSFVQCEKNRDFFNFCYNRIARLCSCNELHVMKSFGKIRQVYRLRTRRMKNLQPIYNDFYDENNKKRLSKNVFSKKIFTPLMLAVWFMGDGAFFKGSVKLCTHCFTYAEHVVMVDCFKKTFGLVPKIIRQNKYYYLRFTRDDSEKFINIVRPFVVEGMKYKITGQRRNDFITNRCLVAEIMVRDLVTKKYSKVFRIYRDQTSKTFKDIYSEVVKGVEAI